MKVSNSRVNCYLSCPQKHYWGYVMRLKTKAPVRPLSFGGDFHKLLEFRDNPDLIAETLTDIQDKYYELPPNYQSALGEDYLQDLKTVFDDYQRVWRGVEKPIETEHEFLIRIGTYKGEPIYFHGLVDEIYDGGKLGEHKTFSRQPDMGILAMNTQICLYAKALELETGEKAQRVMWDYTKSVPADMPVWLEKSKRFSEASNQKITHLSWLRACDERGIIDQETRTKALRYEPNIGNFFFRCEFEILPVMVDTLWDSFVATIKHMISNQNNKVKNVTRDCSWCNYRPLCYAEFTGLDINPIIKREYVEKAPEDEIVMEE